MFGRRFKKLINSDRYKNSGYTIQKVNGLYGLKHNCSGGYVDLRWEMKYNGRCNKRNF